MPHPNRLKLPSVSAKQQAKNKLLWNDARSAETADFFTIGYIGRQIIELLNSLEVAGVRSLIDIRQNPVSMYRPELSKENLRRIVEEHGLRYFHFPHLGVPRDIRAKAVESGSRDIIWDWYDQYVVAPFIRRNLNWFFNSVEHPVAFMCVEIDPKECHRHRLFIALEEMGLHGFDL